MKLQPQLFNQLPGIPQDQVLATPNVAEPQNMINEAMTLPEEAQANMANMVQQQAMAWADILRKGRIAEEAKVKKRASNLYRPMVAEYARELDSGERRPQPEGYAGQLHKAFSDSPISKIGTPFVGDVKTDMENWHEKTKQEIVQQLGIQDDDTLIASVGEELDSLFITPKAKILSLTQARYTEEAKRMASDYLSEVSLEAINNKGMTDEKVASYLQSMVEAGIFQDRDTIDLLKEYEKNVDNNQMNYDAAANPLDFVKSIEDNSWKQKYPNASPNFAMSAYGRYKPVQVAETKKQKKLREDKLKELSHMNLSQLQERRPVTLINDILGGETLPKATLMSLIRNNEEPVLSEDRVKELLESGEYPGVKAHEFSAYLNNAYKKIIQESNAQLTGQKQKTKEQFRELVQRFREKASLNESWPQNWTQLNAIGDGPGWWNDPAFNGMGFETERKDLDSYWKWIQKKNVLMQKVANKEISQPEMVQMLDDLNPEKSIESNDDTNAIAWKRDEYTNLKAHLQRTFLNPTDISKKDQDFAGFAMEQTGVLENWTPQQAVPFEQIVGFQGNWKKKEIPESAAEFFSAGFRVIPGQIRTAMDSALSQVKQSESAGDMEAFLGMFEHFYPEEKHQEIAIREFAALNPDFDSSYLLFTDPAIDKKGDPLQSAYVDETIQAAVAESSVLINQVKDKYGEDGQEFINDLSGDAGEVGQVFYGDFGFGKSTAMRNSPTAIEPYRALHERMAMKLKLRKPDLSAEEAAEMAHHQLFDVRYKIYKNPEDETQVLFMPHSKFQRGYAGMAEPDDVTKAESMVIAGIAPSMLMSLGEMQGAFAKQKNEKLLELEVTGRDGAINRNVNNLLRKVADQFNIAEDAIRRNPNIEILPVPNENNSGRYYKLIHPDTGVWVWLQNKAGEKWEISTDQIADMTFQTHYRAFYHKMPEYLEEGKSWAQSAFEKFEDIKPDFLPSVDSDVAKKFFETDSPIEILQEIADSPAYFNDTPDLDVSVTEWPFDYRVFNVAPDSPWMIGGIERAHLKNEFLPALKERYGDNPTKEQILELSDEYTKRYADLTGRFYFDHVWRFFGVDPLEPQNYILPEGMRPGSLPVSKEQEQQMEEEIQATVKPAP